MIFSFLVIVRNFFFSQFFISFMAYLTTLWTPQIALRRIIQRSVEYQYGEHVKERSPA
jgi:hypothetical protein